MKQQNKNRRQQQKDNLKVVWNQYKSIVELLHKPETVIEMIKTSQGSNLSNDVSAALSTPAVGVNGESHNELSDSIPHGTWREDGIDVKEDVMTILTKQKYSQKLDKSFLACLMLSITLIFLK